jgi:predicted nucleic acid-binding Zn ribbon protein
MLEEKFAYCRLCDMPTGNLKRFCCEKCERLFSRFVKRKNEEKHLRVKGYEKFAMEKIGA